MRKIFNLTCILATIAIFFSCSKEPVTSVEPSDAPEGYTKVYFTAGVATKTVVGNISNDRTAINWTGTEPINVWYKDADGKANKVAAEFVSFSGTQAQLSALIPNDADMTEFIAEVNGVIDTDKLPFGIYDSDNNIKTAPRCEVPANQTAVLNSFDPAAAVMGARWVQSESKPTPELTFLHMTNLLKISVKNETGKTLNKIVLNNTTPIANKNYWYIEDSGNRKVEGSADGSKEITLSGNDIKDGDYYFVISAKCNSTMTLKNLSITFHFSDETYRTYTNPNEIALGGYTICETIGNFVITSDQLEQDVDDSSWAPFGTAWGNTQIKNATPLAEQYWYVAYAKSPNSSAVANFKTTKDIGPDGKYLQGDVTFEFVTKSTGTGVVTFTLESAKANSHTSIVYVNGVEKQRFQYEQAWTRIAKSAELTVKKGDKITIKANNGSNNQKLYFYSNVDHSITWNEKQ